MSAIANVGNEELEKSCDRRSRTPQATIY